METSANISRTDRTKSARSGGARYARGRSEAAVRLTVKEEPESLRAANSALANEVPRASAVRDEAKVLGSEGGTRIPPAKDAKINMRVFAGNELHNGLGSGFMHWARGFRDEIKMAQQACGYLWAEKLKISKLGGCLRGKAEEFFNGLQDEW